MSMPSLHRSCLSTICALAMAIGPVAAHAGAPAESAEAAPADAEADAAAEGESPEAAEGEEGEAPEGAEGAEGGDGAEGGEGAEGEDGAGEDAAAEGEEGAEPAEEEPADDDAAEEEPADEEPAADEEPIEPEGPTRPPEPRVADKPYTGKGLIITGATVTGVGAAFIVTSLLITKCDYNSSLNCKYGAQRELLVPTAAVTTALGVTLLTVGLIKRANYKRWERWTPGQEATLAPTFGRDGAGFAYSARF